MGVRYDCKRSWVSRGFEVDERQPFTVTRRADTKQWMDMLTCKKQAHAWNQEEKKKKKKRRERGGNGSRKGDDAEVLGIKWHLVVSQHCRIPVCRDKKGDVTCMPAGS